MSIYFGRFFFFFFFLRRGVGGIQKLCQIIGYTVLSLVFYYFKAVIRFVTAVVTVKCCCYNISYYCCVQRSYNQKEHAVLFLSF